MAGFDREVEEKRLRDVPRDPRVPGAYAPDECNKATGQIGREAYTEEYLLREIFTYHPPSPYQQKCYESVREAAKHFATIILHNVPTCADRTAALRKVREAVMTANAAIALDGLSF